MTILPSNLELNGHSLKAMVEFHGWRLQALLKGFGATKMDPEELRLLVISSIEEQGFSIQGHKILPPANPSKEEIRQLHALAVRSRLERAKKNLKRYETRLISDFAGGNEVDPERIQPRLVEVTPDSKEELLFRYACLHWSIPVSSGYGRRLRFLVMDSFNNKLMGLFGLGDPVFGLGPRDRWVGWNREDRKARLQYVMDAFVLGSVPPYSYLLCGKLIALLIASDEVREAFRMKYCDRPSLIKGKVSDGKLVLITTTSALGRSSVYNRLSFQNRPAFYHVGYTTGTGDFHFNNGLYRDLWSHAMQNCNPSAKQAKWGKGFRNRRETVRKCLSSLGLPLGWMANWVRREIFAIPLAANFREFLLGKSSELAFFNQSADTIYEWFRVRWLLARAHRDRRYVDFDPRSLILWEGRQND